MPYAEAMVSLTISRLREVEEPVMVEAASEVTALREGDWARMAFLHCLRNSPTSR